MPEDLVKKDKAKKKLPITIKLIDCFFIINFKKK